MSPDQHSPRRRPAPVDPRLSRPGPRPRGERPTRTARPWSRTGLVVSSVVAVAALVILFGVGAAAENIQHDSTGSPASGAAGQRKSPPAPAAGLGHSVRDGKFAFVVGRVDCSRATVGAEHLKRTAAGKYCVISLSIENTAEQPRLFVGRLQKVFDAAGTEFTDDEAAGLLANPEKQTLLRKIDPGRRVSGKIVFDVPKGTRLTVMELHDSPFSGGVRVTLK